MTASHAALLDTVRIDPAAGKSDGAGVRAPAMLERQLEVLGELAEIGLNLVRAIERQATGPVAPDVDADADSDPAPAIQGDLCLAYGRVSRAVRLTIALQAKLIADLQAREAGAGDGEGPGLRGGEDTVRTRVRRIVGRVILARHDEIEDVERVDAECRELLESEPLDGEVLSKPLSEIVDIICWNLGLSPDWTRLIHEAWAQAEIKGGAPGGPLTETMAMGASGSAPQSLVGDEREDRADDDPGALMPAGASR